MDVHRPTLSQIGGKRFEINSINCAVASDYLDVALAKADETGFEVAPMICGQITLGGDSGPDQRARPVAPTSQPLCAPLYSTQAWTTPNDQLPTSVANNMKQTSQAQ
ncbi:hypothetical protein SARC_05939 [Sphaeroforma arctica JP610]|uniref:Uncharacterized protein n=1 Tax=Sphaeroforma arctica JP610 TaxID=667725 RepID=A0A0L0FY46_9EUKA|nr:hypothetical protein SARC_05939 [Sphaeroforma arctica JP610]KNC81755.1 hypothetical protein SARC_05939 [Sphaeroforma arctica JP610]|eukprot:XP_014155657.1 hypothetical protein SARC_05939 [Sphaeroforma arctica JP610]